MTVEFARSWPTLFMTVSTAIADSPLRQACTLEIRVQAGGLAAQSVNILFSSMPPSLAAPRARLAWRLRDFATNRHE